ncbi:hypothetical protein HanOQP8_Chr08g0294991 [Helianthus annuus]|nr:hypothetical protein HanHA89_Chr08g0306831 [Helianthus annuus]KAJ0719949.1 hypothetical protein HanLR1_Chr08g0287521 [Helianthus annuus]KAJ0723173.1 hypothetical protein HanOQP8_Chr08g0294991 [Helianthus annuus]
MCVNRVREGERDRECEKWRGRVASHHLWWRSMADLWQSLLTSGECCTPTYRTKDKESDNLARIPVDLNPEISMSTRDGWRWRLLELGLRHPSVSLYYSVVLAQSESAPMGATCIICTDAL